MYAVDTNILVHAHNNDSPLNKKAKTFLGKVMNQRDMNGNLTICIPAQVFLEFIHVITWERLESPISFSQALHVVQEYLDTGITIVHQRETQLQSFLDLAQSLTTRKRVFDIALAATLRDNEISGIYTVNINDFEGLDFLEVVNPLK
jgi:hypothetical protein